MYQTQIELDQCIIWPILSISVHMDTWLLCLRWLFTCIDLPQTFVTGENASVHEMGFCYIICRLSLRCLVSEWIFIYHPGRVIHTLGIARRAFCPQYVLCSKVDSLYSKILQTGTCPLGVSLLWQLCGHTPQSFPLMTRKSWGGSSFII